MSQACEQCGGSGFLNVEQLPQEILESDPKRFRLSAIEWILTHEGHEVEVCPQCLYEECDDMIRMMQNRVWQKGGMKAVEEMKLRLRTCNYCGHVATVANYECPICGKLRIGKP